MYSIYVCMYVYVHIILLFSYFPFLYVTLQCITAVLSTIASCLFLYICFFVKKKKKKKKVFQYHETCVKNTEREGRRKGLRRQT